MDREEIRFASGGAECAAWLYRAVGVTGPVPCAVMASGLSCVRGQRLDAFAERFAAAGFAALAFDYRHFGDSGGEPRSLISAARQRQDWRAALAYARALEEVDAGRIAIWGFSLGGGNVQALAISDPGVAAAICVCPLVDGIRTLLHIGGPAHVARLGVAGVRDGLRALGIEAAGRAPAGELRRYPGGHFAPLYGESFEPAVADQLEFLERVLAGG